VSKATLVCLGDEFDVESADGDTRDSYLVERGIDTFFIVPQSQTPQLPANRVLHLRAGDTIRYDTRCYVNARSKANMSQLNLPHGTDN